MSWCWQLEWLVSFGEWSDVVGRAVWGKSLKVEMEINYCHKHPPFLFFPPAQMRLCDQEAMLKLKEQVHTRAKPSLRAA